MGVAANAGGREASLHRPAGGPFDGVSIGLRDGLGFIYSQVLTGTRDVSSNAEL